MSHERPLTAEDAQFLDDLQAIVEDIASNARYLPAQNREAYASAWVDELVQSLPKVAFARMHLAHFCARVREQLEVTLQ